MSASAPPLRPRGGRRARVRVPARRAGRRPARSGLARGGLGVRPRRGQPRHGQGLAERTRRNRLEAGQRPACRRRPHRREALPGLDRLVPADVHRSRDPGRDCTGRCASSRCGGRARLAERPEIGVHRDPYSAFELAANGLRPGQPNTLVVRADYRRPAGLREGWWNWGGITRQVALVARGAVVRRTPACCRSAPARPTSCSWRVLVDGWLETRAMPFSSRRSRCG